MKDKSALPRVTSVTVTNRNAKTQNLTDTKVVGTCLRETVIDRTTSTVAYRSLIAGTPKPVCWTRKQPAYA